MLTQIREMQDWPACLTAKDNRRMPPRAIVIALDELSRRCFGCYGHEWIETPNLDRLAARGVVFDQCLASPADEPALRDATLSWIEQMQRKGVTVRWLREPNEPANVDLEDLSKASLAQLVTQAEQTLEELSQAPEASWLLWLESRGIGWPGLATPQFVELYADELDDVPADLVGFREIEVAYAALLTQFDHLVGQLMATTARLFGDASPMLIVMSAHGQSVGEVEMLASFANPTSGLSPDANPFRDEFVHPPLLIAGGARDMLGSRRSELVVPADIRPTLSEWFGISATTMSARDERSLLPLLQNTECVPRSVLHLKDDDGGTAVRTGDFYFIQPKVLEQADESDLSGWLFLKPEDVWELNDVASQYPDQVAQLRASLRTWMSGQNPNGC